MVVSLGRLLPVLEPARARRALITLYAGLSRPEPLVVGSVLGTIDDTTIAAIRELDGVVEDGQRWELLVLFEETVLFLTESKNPSIRRIATRALGYLDRDSERLRQLTNDRHRRVRIYARFHPVRTEKAVEPDS